MNTLPFLGLKRSHNSYLHDLAVAKETLNFEREEWEVERAQMLARISCLESQCTDLKVMCTNRKERISGLLLAGHRREQEEEKEGQAVASKNLDVALNQCESERADRLAQIPSFLGSRPHRQHTLARLISTFVKIYSHGHPAYNTQDVQDALRSERADLMEHIKLLVAQNDTFFLPIALFVYAL